MDDMDDEQKRVCINEADFEAAQESLTPSISQEELDRYKSIRMKFVS